MPNKNIIKMAVNAALRSEEIVRVGAVLYKGGACVNDASNSRKFIGYRANVFEFEPTRHAEIGAIHRIRRDVLEECDMIVVRVSRKTNELTSAKPCKACMSAIKSAGIRRLYYSDYSGNIIKVNPRNVDIVNWEKEIPAL